MLPTFFIKVSSFILVGSLFQGAAVSFAYPSSYSYKSRRNLFQRNSSPEDLFRNVFDELLPGLPILYSFLFHPPHSHTHSNNIKKQEVLPVPEDVAEKRSSLPDLGFLTDLAFLLLPRDFPVSGMLRLSRDLFESEQCVQFVSCEMTRTAYKHGKYFSWMNNFLLDFPFEGDIAERMRQGANDTLDKLKKGEENVEKTVEQGNGNEDRENKICTFSCSPIRSLSRGLKILSLLHDLVRTVKY